MKVPPWLGSAASKSWPLLAGCASGVLDFCAGTSPTWSWAGLVVFVPLIVGLHQCRTCWEHMILFAVAAATSFFSGFWWLPGAYQEVVGVPPLVGVTLLGVVLVVESLPFIFAGALTHFLRQKRVLFWIAFPVEIGRAHV